MREGVWSLEVAVQRLAAHPAARFGLRDRGLLRAGMAADVVVFDPETIADLALYPYTAWADEAGLSLGNRPGIRRWLRLVESQPGFLPLMKDGAATSMSFADYCKRSALP